MKCVIPSCSTCVSCQQPRVCWLRNDSLLPTASLSPRMARPVKRQSMSQTNPLFTSGNQSTNTAQLQASK